MKKISNQPKGISLGFRHFRQSGYVEKTRPLRAIFEKPPKIEKKILKEFQTFLHFFSKNRTIPAIIRN